MRPPGPCSTVDPAARCVHTPDRLTVSGTSAQETPLAVVRPRLQIEPLPGAQRGGSLDTTVIASMSCSTDALSWSGRR